MSCVRWILFQAQTISPSKHRESAVLMLGLFNGCIGRHILSSAHIFVLLLSYILRRWPNITPTSAQRLVLAG